MVQYNISNKIANKLLKPIIIKCMIITKALNNIILIIRFLHHKIHWEHILQQWQALHWHQTYHQLIAHKTQDLFQTH